MSYKGYQNEVVNHIVDWIKKQAGTAQSLVVGISGGVDSALVAALCQKTGLRVVGVKMPCHSSGDGQRRADEVANLFCDTIHRVDLAPAFDIIERQVGMIPFDKKAAHGALRSCLRAPTLDYVAKLYGGIIVGTGNRDEDEVTRYYQKRGDGSVDISPIAKLHKSEVYELAAHLGVPESVLKATPSADLWGPDAGQTDEGQLGMTYAEIEWGIQHAARFAASIGEFYDGDDGDVTAREFALSLLADGLSTRQEKVLLQLASMEKASRHKKNPNLPVCPRYQLAQKDEFMGAQRVDGENP